MKHSFAYLLCAVAASTAPVIHAATPTATQTAAPLAKPAVKPRAVANASFAANEPKLRPASVSVTQIVERNAAARGGLEAWHKITALTMTGKMDAGRARVVNPADYQPGHKRPLNVPGSEADRGTLVQLPFVMDFKRPRKSRVEIDFQGQKAIQIYDGTKGYKLRPFLNRTDWQPFSAEEIKVAAQQQELDGALMDYATKGTHIDVEGVAPIEGHDAYRLRLKFKDGQEEHLWVDATSYLEVRIDSARTVGARSRPIRTYLRDYRSVNGVKIPYVTETQTEGRPDPERIMVESASVNPPMDDARFVPPVAVPASPAPSTKPVTAIQGPAAAPTTSPKH